MGLKTKSFEPNKDSMWRRLIGSPAVQQTGTGLILTGLILTGASIARCSQRPDRESLPQALKGADAQHSFGIAIAAPKAKQCFARLEFMPAYASDRRMRKDDCPVSAVCPTSLPLNAFEQSTDCFQSQAGV